MGAASNGARGSGSRREALNRFVSQKRGGHVGETFLGESRGLRALIVRRVPRCGIAQIA